MAYRYGTFDKHGRFTSVNAVGSVQGTKVSTVIRQCTRDGKCLCLQRDHGRALSMINSEYNCILKNYRDHKLRAIVAYINILTPEQKAVFEGEHGKDRPK